ncbi:MAG: thioredoxin family protein [Pseudolysinimonas sp.]
MSKRLIAVIVVLVVVIGGAVGALWLTKTVNAPPPTPTAIANDTSDDADEPAGDAVASIPGTYVDYTETAIADAQGKVVLFFHAPWCGQCRTLEEGILADGVPDGVTVIKVDWDTHQDLEVQYGVPMRTTFVELDADGEVVQRLTAYDDPRWEAVVETMAL